MELVLSLDRNPEEIKELDLIERIIGTLRYFCQKNGTEYAFVQIQSSALGISCFPAPKNYVPSNTSVLLGKYDMQYWQNERDVVINK